MPSRLIKHHFISNCRLLQRQTFYINAKPPTSEWYQLRLDYCGGHATVSSHESCSNSTSDNSNSRSCCTPEHNCKLHYGGIDGNFHSSHVYSSVETLTCQPASNARPQPKCRWTSARYSSASNYSNKRGNHRKLVEAFKYTLGSECANSKLVKSSCMLLTKF